MGCVTLEKYNDQYLCVRMRFKDPAGRDLTTTFTSGGFQEGLNPISVLLWRVENRERAEHDYRIIVNEIENSIETRASESDG
jgi:hypothetical protein